MRVNRRFEGVPGRVKRAFEPAPQGRHQHRRAIAAGGHELVEQRVDTLRILERRDSPSQQQRQRDPGHLNHIRPLIELRSSRVFGRDQPQVLPQPADRQLQPIEGGAEDMLDDDEAAVGRQDHPIGRSPPCAIPRPWRCSSATADVSSRMNQAAKAGCTPACAFGLLKISDTRLPVVNVDTSARSPESRRWIARTRENAGWSKAVELVDALPKGILEAVRRREQRMKAEQLEGRRAAVVEHPQAIPDAVADALGIPAGQGLRRVEAAPSVDGGSCWRGVIVLPTDVHGELSHRTERGSPTGGLCTALCTKRRVSAKRKRGCAAVSASRSGRTPRARGPTAGDRSRCRAPILPAA